MSLKKDNKRIIKEYMLEKIESNENVVEKTQENFSISKTTIYHYLQELIEAGAIEKYGKGKYRTVKKYKYFSYENTRLVEDVVFREDIAPLLQEQHVSENVMRIWAYAFTEMMNNAIEHSMADKIQVMVSISYSYITIFIVDEGVGIFKKIKEFYHYDSIDDAISELFKGKLTTDSQNHSGEGIFFTSRILDNFAAISDKRVFTHDDYSEVLDEIDENHRLRELADVKGTLIFMRLATRSRKEIKEVFDMYSDAENGFHKTNIPMKNVFGNNFPVSRSQARRLCNRLEKFKEVTLDFAGVDEIGQAFSHELFVKYPRLNPEVKLNIVNANDEVQKMIKRVKNTQI